MVEEVQITYGIFNDWYLVIGAVFLYAANMHKKHEESGVFLFYNSYLQKPGQDVYDRALYKDIGCTLVAVRVFGLWSLLLVFGQDAILSF